MNVAFLFFTFLYLQHTSFPILYRLFEKVQVCNLMQLDLGSEQEMCLSDCADVQIRQCIHYIQADLCLAKVDITH